MADSFPTQSGTVLRDRYVLQELVHSDHWSYTLRALRQPDQQSVILRLPNPNSVNSGVNLAFHAAWMQRVYQSLCQIHHPNRAAVMDYLESHGLPILVQQDIAGLPLHQKLLRQPLSEREAVVLVRKIAIALSGIHGKGLIHRDVRPETIIERANTQHPVLIGWGLQPSCFPANRASSYAAPEQFQPGGRFQPSIDVYGLAASLYAMVTGQPPIHAALRDKTPLSQPRQLQPQLSIALERAILQGMDLNPQDRPPSMGAWLGLLPEVITPSPPTPFGATVPPSSASARGQSARSHPYGAPFSPASASPGLSTHPVDAFPHAGAPSPAHAPANAVQDAIPSDPSPRPSPSRTTVAISSQSVRLSTPPVASMKTLISLSLTAAFLGVAGGLVLRITHPESVAGISGLGRTQTFPERAWPEEGSAEAMDLPAPEPYPQPEDPWDGRAESPWRTESRNSLRPQEERLPEVLTPDVIEEAPVLPARRDLSTFDTPQMTPQRTPPRTETDPATELEGARERSPSGLPPQESGWNGDRPPSYNTRPNPAAPPRLPVEAPLEPEFTGDPEPVYEGPETALPEPEPSNLDSGLDEWEPMPDSSPQSATPQPATPLAGEPWEDSTF